MRILRLTRTLLVGMVLAVFAGVMLFSTVVAAAEFSADLVVTDREGEQEGRIYVKNGMMRFELSVEGELMVTIIDPNQHGAWQLLPQNVYMEIPISEAPGALASDEYDEMSLGVETVQGYVCDVTRLIYRDKSLGVVTHWIARKLDYPLKIEVVDGKNRITETIEYTNIKEEALNDALFEVPKGYVKMELFGFGSLFGSTKSQGSESRGKSTSSDTSGTQGISGFPSVSGMPENMADMFKNIPGLPENFGMTQMQGEDDADLPDAYQGTLSVSVKGEREWEVLLVGIGEEYAHFREVVYETASVYVPEIILSVGTAYGQVIKATVGWEYRRYEDHVLIEHRLYGERSIESQFCPCYIHYNKFNPYGSGTYTVAFNGFEFLGPVGESSSYYSDGTLQRTEKASYEGHTFSFEVPKPTETNRLTGSKTFSPDGKDWVTVEVSWDFYPVSDN